MKKMNVLKKNYEFQEIINKKNQKVSDHLIVYFKKTDGPLRVGISVSKKFANAVKRNKQRRHFRNILDGLNPYDMKYDLIIILRKSFLDMSFQDKTKETKKILERL